MIMASVLKGLNKFKTSEFNFYSHWNHQKFMILEEKRFINLLKFTKCYNNKAKKKKKMVKIPSVSFFQKMRQSFVTKEIYSKQTNVTLIRQKINIDPHSLNTNGFRLCTK